VEYSLIAKGTGVKWSGQQSCTALPGWTPGCTSVLSREVKKGYPKAALRRKKDQVNTATTAAPYLMPSRTRQYWAFTQTRLIPRDTAYSWYEEDVLDLYPIEASGRAFPSDGRFDFLLGRFE
jgi:hypothetical protein